MNEISSSAWPKTAVHGLERRLALRRIAAQPQHVSLHLRRFRRDNTEASSSLVEPTQVRCAIASIPA